MPTHTHTAWHRCSSVPVFATCGGFYIEAEQTPEQVSQHADGVEVSQARLTLDASFGAHGAFRPCGL